MEKFIMEEIETLIHQSSEQDFNAANQTFAQIMADKMETALDQERVKISATIYNDVDPEQLELDLGDDDAEEVTDEDFVEDEEPEDEDDV
jgi:hypothetical protein